MSLVAVILFVALSAFLFYWWSQILNWITSEINNMGIPFSEMYIEGKKPPEIPDSFVKPTFDPEYGFKVPRQQRVSKLSEQEMKALKIQKSSRDYCAHYLKDYLVCTKQYMPLTGLCNPEYHAYEHCEMDDYILRMKEYEREKRLRMRELRKQKAA